MPGRLHDGARTDRCARFRAAFSGDLVRTRGGPVPLLACSSIASGDAVKIVEEIPTTRPSSSATAKSVSESPPSTASAARMNIAPSPVLTVRGTVCRIAALTTSRERRLRRCAAHSSRTRSNTTTVSLTA